MTLLHLLPAGSELRPPTKPRRLGCCSSARQSWQISVIRRLFFQLLVMGIRTAIWLLMIDWANRNDIGDTAGGTEIRLIMFMAVLGLSLWMLTEAFLHRQRILGAIRVIASRATSLEAMGVSITYSDDVIAMPHRHAQSKVVVDTGGINAHHETGEFMTAAHAITLVLLARNNKLDDGRSPRDFVLAVNTMLQKPAKDAVKRAALAGPRQAATAEHLAHFHEAAEALKTLKTDRMHDAMWQYCMVLVFIFFFVTPAHYAVVFGWWSMLVTPAVGLILLGPMQLARVIRKPIENQTPADAAAFGYVAIEGDMFVGVVSRSGSLLGGVFYLLKSAVCSLFWCRRTTAPAFTGLDQDADVEQGSGRRRRRR